MLPVFRRPGARTQTEMDEGRQDLKSLRGDCRDVGANPGRDGGRRPRLTGPDHGPDAGASAPRYSIQ